MRHRTSCDTCHARKQKCDLLQISAAATSQGTNQSCTFCRCLGVECKVTTKEKDGAASGAAALQLRQTKKRRVEGKSERHNIFSINHDEDNITQQDRSDPKEAGDVSITSATLERPRLLNIEGLSARALEECIDAFYNHLGAWMVIRDSHEVFKTRFQLFLAQVQGVESSNFRKGSLTAASELLVLAVAARGSFFIKEYGCLRNKLLSRITSLAQEPHRSALERLDAMEGCILASEISAQPLFYGKSRNKDPTCLRLNPIGKGIAAELCLYHRFNEEPSKLDPLYESKSRLFWFSFLNDAFGSASAGRMYRISDEDIGWMDAEDPIEWPLIPLGYLARRLTRVLLSSRSRRFGVSLLDLRTLIGALEEYPARVGISFDKNANEQQSPSYSPGQVVNFCTLGLNLHKKNKNGTREQQNKLISSAIVVAFWLRLSLSVWMQMRARKHSPLSEEMMLVEDHMRRQSNHVITLANLCIEHRLIDHGSNQFLGSLSAWILFFMHKISEARLSTSSSNSSLTGKIDAEVMVNNARKVLQAIRSSRVYPEAVQIADRLEQKLQGGYTVPLSELSQVAESSTAILGRKERDGSREITAALNAGVGIEDEEEEEEASNLLHATSSLGDWTNEFRPAAIADTSSSNIFSLNGMGDVGMRNGISALEASIGNDELGDQDWLRFFQICGVEFPNGGDFTF